LEDHAFSFTKWQSGFGPYGEQGVEGFHANFNRLKVSYSSVHPSTKRVVAMMKEHYLQIHPEARSEWPKIKRRKMIPEE